MEFWVAVGVGVVLLYIVARQNRVADERTDAQSGVVQAGRRTSVDSVIAGAPRSLIRIYKARTAADADLLFKREAAELAEHGYTPTQQRWAPGQWRGIDFVAAVLLMLLLVGILIFIYMILVKPAGTLTVTYEKAAQTAWPSPAVAPPTASDAAARLSVLDDLRSQGVLTDAEYEAKRRDVISQL